MVLAHGHNPPAANRHRLGDGEVRIHRQHLLRVVNDDIRGLSALPSGYAELSAAAAIPRKQDRAAKTIAPEV